MGKLSRVSEGNLSFERIAEGSFVSLADMTSPALAGGSLLWMEVFALVGRSVDTLASKRDVVGTANVSLVLDGDPSPAGVAKDPYRLMLAFLDRDVEVGQIKGSMLSNRNVYIQRYFNQDNSILDH